MRLRYSQYAALSVSAVILISLCSTTRSYYGQIHGNHCGKGHGVPGYPPIDGFDRCCMEYDACPNSQHAIRGIKCHNRACSCFKAEVKRQGTPGARDLCFKIMREVHWAGTLFKRICCGKHI